MFALRRPVVLVALVIALVAGVSAAMSLSSRGSDSERVETQGVGNCAPTARDDAVSTRPNEPVAIDVLTNDVDVDHERLALSIVKVSDGTASIDDAGTPKDARDDKLLYTPDEPSKPEAIVVYRVEDGAGNHSTARVAVSISEVVAETAEVSTADSQRPANDRVGRGCTDRSGETVASEPEVPPGEITGSADALSASKSTSRPAGSPSSRSTTTTAQQAGSVTTTTQRPSADADPPNTTRPTSSPTTATTRPTSTSNPDPPPCDYNDPTGQHCSDYANSKRSTTTQPQP